MTDNRKKRAVWFGWGNLECFMQISPPDCNLECWSFLAETWIPETKGNHRIYEMKSFNGHLNYCGRVY